MDLLAYSTIIPVIPFQLQRLGYSETSSSALTGWLLFAYVSHSPSPQKPLFLTIIFELLSHSDSYYVSSRNLKNASILNISSYPSNCLFIRDLPLSAVIYDNRYHFIDRLNNPLHGGSCVLCHGGSSRHPRSQLFIRVDSRYGTNVRKHTIS